MRKLLALLLLAGILIPNLLKAEGDEADKDKRTISGYIKDSETGEDLIGATVYIEELKSGTVSNVYGFYSISLDLGTYTIKYSYIGYTPIIFLTPWMRKAFQSITPTLYLALDRDLLSPA